MIKITTWSVLIVKLEEYTLSLSESFKCLFSQLSSISSLNSHISKIEASVGTLTTDLNNYVKTTVLSAIMENINASINSIDSSLDSSIKEVYSYVNI